MDIDWRFPSTSERQSINVRSGGPTKARPLDQSGNVWSGSLPQRLRFPPKMVSLCLSTRSGSNVQALLAQPSRLRARHLSSSAGELIPTTRAASSTPYPSPNHHPSRHPVGPTTTVMIPGICFSPELSPPSPYLIGLSPPSWVLLYLSTALRRLASLLSTRSSSRIFALVEGYHTIRPLAETRYHHLGA